MCSRAGGVHKGRVPLQLFDHLLVFFARLYAGHPKRNNFNAAQLSPFCAQHLVQRIGQLRCVAGQSGITNPHLADFGKSRLQRRHQLTFQLAVDFCPPVGLFHIAAHVGIKQDRVCNAVAVLAEASDGDVNVDSRALIHHTEGHRAGRAVFVAHQFLGVKEINTLIHGSLAPERKAFTDIAEHRADAGRQISRK